MSAMSASPVKPVLPSGVPPPKVVPTTVSSPVPPSPPKSLPLTSTLSGSPKPPSMNHTTMPLSLIAEHKNMPPAFPLQLPPPQPQSSIPPTVQPLPRTPDKPREITVTPVVIPPISITPLKPTSNGMEGLKSMMNIANPVTTQVPAPILTPIPSPITTPLPAPPVTLNPVSEPSQISSTQSLSLKPDLVPTIPPGLDNQAADKTSSKPDLQNTAKVPEPISTHSNDSAITEIHPVAPATTATTPTATIPVTTAPLTKTSSSLVSTPASSVAATTAHTPIVTTSVATAAAAVALTTATDLTSSPSPVVSTAKPQSTTIPVPPAPVEALASSSKPEPVATKTRSESVLPTPKPELKVATIIPRGSKRKRETKPPPAASQITNKKESSNNNSDERKSKRVRLPTQPYQSPLPELNIIAKMNKTPVKAVDDKLIVFYKNEFLAVRNAEGGFYVCQAMQNIFKSSPRIRIRWLSHEANNVYSPDFYDNTDFDCILTNLNLERVDKEKFRLPPVEQVRTESILKRALDVEKGVSEKPPVTEEHPDGLDLSLFRDESQLKKSASKTRSRGSASGKKSTDSKKDEVDEKDDDIDEGVEEDSASESSSDNKKKKKEAAAPKPNKKKKKPAKKKRPPPQVKKAPVKKAVAQPPKKKVTATEVRVAPKRKASSAPSTQPTEKRAKKPETSSQLPDRSSKTRSAGVVGAAKSRRDRRTTVKTRK